MTQETITQIPLEQLHESPFNPRKTFKGLDELAAGIRSEGRVLQPLLVRPRIANPLRNLDDPENWDGYEIVFGHRRARAAELAGLTTVPCMVRAMTSAQARSAQIAENLQRDDVHPIEEAEGFQSMIENDGLTADQLAELVGKSKSYVYGRLKLLQACDEIRKACLAGEIIPEVTLLIARLRTDKLQAKALTAIRQDTSSAAVLSDGGQRSFRHIRDLLAEKFTLALKTAIFDLEDATLVPSAGVCSACPKRTANAPEFADLATRERPSEHHHYPRPGGPDTCTDPDCFDAKKVAHLARQANKLTQEGKVVLAGNKARNHIGAHGDVKGAYVPLEKVKGLLSKLRPKKGQPGAAAAPEIEVVHIQNPRDGKIVQAVKRTSLEAAGVVKAGDASATEGRAAEEERRRQKQAAEIAEAKDRNDRQLALLMHVRQTIASRQRDEFDLRLVCAAALSGVGYHDRQLVADLHGQETFEALQDALDTMPLRQLETVLMDCAIVDDVRVPYYNNSKPQPLLVLAEHYGIDAEAFMRDAVAPAASPAAARAKQPKAKAAPSADMFTGEEEQVE